MCLELTEDVQGAPEVGLGVNQSQGLPDFPSQELLPLPDLISIPWQSPGASPSPRGLRGLQEWLCHGHLPAQPVLLGTCSSSLGEVASEQGTAQGSAEPLAFAAPSNVCEYAQTDLNLISIASAFIATHPGTPRQTSLCPGGVHTYPQHWPPSGMSLQKKFSGNICGNEILNS